jgi:hypothetical protein
MSIVIPYIMSASVISGSIPNLFVTLVANSMPESTKSEDQFFIAMLVLMTVGIGEMFGGLILG